jgi:hypothetical protein
MTAAAWLGSDGAQSLRAVLRTQLSPGPLKAAQFREGTPGRPGLHEYATASLMHPVHEHT